MAHMTPAQWQRYRDVINEWQEDAFQQEIEYRREIVTQDRYGEDYNKRFERITIKGLILYNYFRSWPMSNMNHVGELDKESCMVYFNIKNLRDQGLLNSHDQFEFDPAYDRFVINGMLYKSTGDSQAAQASNNPLLIFLILRREETDTGSDRIDR